MRWLVILLLAGCSHAHVNGASASTAGGAQGSVHVHNGFGTVFFAGMLIGVTFSDWFWGEPEPELDTTRSVSEQDCTRPVVLEGNLRCR